MFHPARGYRNRLNSRLRHGTGFEALERRDMLSGTPPTVTNVEVASTAWSTAFVGYLQTAGLGTNGYSIPRGSTAQSATLTWDNINQIMLTFSKDVRADAADLSISGINTTAYGISNFRYDPQTHVATWTLNAAIDKDRLRLDLDANGSDPVRDLDQNILDGEWTNNVSTASGNGTAGGDFEFNFNVLPSDVNNTSNITAIDYTYVRQLDGKSTSSSGYVAKRDIDGSGLIDSTDWQEAWDRGGQVLPSGSPAGTNNDAPTTSGFAVVEISDDAVDVAICLPSHFDDVEDGGSGLTYSIVSNSSSSLFDTAAINPSTKDLVLNAANGSSGLAQRSKFEAPTLADFSLTRLLPLTLREITLRRKSLISSPRMLGAEPGFYRATSSTPTMMYRISSLSSRVCIRHARRSTKTATSSSRSYSTKWTGDGNMQLPMIHMELSPMSRSLISGSLDFRFHECRRIPIPHAFPRRKYTIWAASVRSEQAVHPTYLRVRPPKVKPQFLECSLVRPPASSDSGARYFPSRHS